MQGTRIPDLSFDHPPLRDNTIASLWPFQREAVESVFREWDAGRSWTSVYLATGTGKSRLGSNVARRICDHGGNVLVIAHTKDLVRQFAGWLDRAGIPTGIEMGSMHARIDFDPRGVVASVQTMKGERLASWEKDYFDTIIVDECHHLPANGHKAVIDYFQPNRVLGLTATPDRGDMQSLTEMFDSVAYVYSLLQAVKAPPPGPYLCRPIYHLFPVPIELGNLRKKQHDYTDEQLEERILPHVEVVANAVRMTYEGRPAIVFLPGVKSAQMVAASLQSMGMRFDWVSGERKDRADVIARYERGELEGVINVMVLSEGVDIPKTSCVINARPTKIRSLLTQMLGRATRRHDESFKKDFLWVDLAMVTPDHDLLAMPSDCYDCPSVDPEVIKLARTNIRQRAEAGEKVDITDVMEEATKTIRENREVRLKTARRDIAVRSIKFDPITAQEIFAIPKAPNTAISQPATEAQVRTLAQFGFEGCEGVSKRLASNLLDLTFKRKEKGLATVPQVKALLRAGVPIREARAMTKPAASAYLDTVFSERRAR